jgi:hypothetical protein
MNNDKKVVICASAFFEEKILEWKEKLEGLGYNVIKNPSKIDSNFLEKYSQEVLSHYSAIMNCGMILVLNFEKNGIPGYIGSGTFGEMAFANGINKTTQYNIKICYLEDIPKSGLSHCDELNYWIKLGWIKKYQFKFV